jgi:RimJ/RimL family protein N-acetyltransferase
MNNWLQEPVKLLGHLVNLMPLEEEHFAALQSIAADPRIWEFYAYDASKPEKFNQVMKSTMIEKDRGTQYPFIIEYKPMRQIIGSTRFMDIQPQHKKLEIGTTWLHPDYWATAVNLECKYMLLNYCFDILNTVRVQLKTDENNIRSRKAIEKIGGKFEGILRNDMIRDNQTKRNSAYYSIIEEEWPEVKMMLKEKMEFKLNT